jgi:glycolate oxidase iron-sulfur subunit
MRAVEKSGAEKVVTSCPGCVLQLSDLAASKNLPVETIHVVELLERTLKENGREGAAVSEEAEVGS